MKVLQINSVCGYGSTGRIVTDLYDALVENGHECCIAYGRGTAPNKYKTIKIGNKLDNYSHVLETRLLDNHGFASRRATKKFIEEIKQYDPDIIHIHNVHGYYLNIKILFEYLAQLNIPIVWSFHDCWAFSGRSAYLDLDSNGLLPTKTSFSYEKKDYPSTWLFDRYKRNYNFKKKLFSGLENLKIVTPSTWLADLTKKTFLNKYPVSVIHNGIDLSKFEYDNNQNFRKTYRLEGKKIVLGVASVWDRRKGIEYFNQLVEKLDSNLYQVVIVGDTLNNKLSPKIISINKTNNIEELASIYSSADVFVNTTLADNFPTTNLEAMACGTPVVTFNTGGSPESIDRFTGKTIEKEDIEGLLVAIIEVSSKKNQYIDKCIQRSKEFEKNLMYRTYLDIYRKWS